MTSEYCEIHFLIDVNLSWWSRRGYLNSLLLAFEQTPDKRQKLKACEAARALRFFLSRTLSASSVSLFFFLHPITEGLKSKIIRQIRSESVLTIVL